jgi:alpha-D-ribose 1-methylphosphonate 5-triphosphate diphosphatase PhnM
MPDDKTQVRVSDRRIFADQDNEVSNLAQKYGLSQAQIRELISRVGNDSENSIKPSTSISSICFRAALAFSHNDQTKSPGSTGTGADPPSIGFGFLGSQRRMR